MCDLVKIVGMSHNIIIDYRSEHKGEKHYESRFL